MLFSNTPINLVLVNNQNLPKKWRNLAYSLQTIWNTSIFSVFQGFLCSKLLKYYDVKKGLFLAAKVHQKKANLEFSVKSQQTQAFRHHDHDKLAEKAKFRRQLLLFGRWWKKICSKIIFLHTVLLSHTTTIQHSAKQQTPHTLSWVAAAVSA